MPQVNGMQLETLDEYVAWEQRAWHSAWADRGLLLKNMSPEEARSVRELDADRGLRMRVSARQATSESHAARRSVPESQGVDPEC